MRLPLPIATSGPNESWDFLADCVAGRLSTRPAWDLEPDYQRPAVWTRDQQVAFVAHALSGGLVNPIFVQRDEGDDPPEVIDGKQRLVAIVAFMAGEFSVVIDDGREIRATDLSRSAATSRVVYVDMPRAERLRFYLRLNSAGTPHSATDIERVQVLLASSTT
jgi:uncharacterized protein with ParB-like and HNH nuclease domain